MEEDGEVMPRLITDYQIVSYDRDTWECLTCGELVSSEQIAEHTICHQVAALQE